LQFHAVAPEQLPLEAVTLIYEVLYRDWKVARDPQEQWLECVQGGEFILAQSAGGRLLACARMILEPPEPPPLEPPEPQALQSGAPRGLRMQLRQVAVCPAFRGRGIGRVLMAELECRGRAVAADELWLRAREPAWGFYEKLGYTYCSGVYESALTKIPHRSMVKVLSSNKL
jgi:GNAT superfamily N-acetyltransferase